MEPSTGFHRRREHFGDDRLKGAFRMQSLAMKLLKNLGIPLFDPTKPPKFPFRSIPVAMMVAVRSR